MTITLYKIPDDKRQVDKTLNSTTNLGDLTAHFKEDTDILNPVLEIAYNAIYTSANYVYISDWNRWYFITGMETGAQRLYLRCHVDVLYTYKDQIRALSCVIARQEDENNANLYLNDGMWHNLQYKQIARAVYPVSFDDHGSYILAICGES